MKNYIDITLGNSRIQKTFGVSKEFIKDGLAFSCWLQKENNKIQKQIKLARFIKEKLKEEDRDQRDE